jgi:hypothetical protein
LEAHDLAVSKLVAGRERDLAFVRNLVHFRLIDPAVFKNRLSATRIDPKLFDSIRARLNVVGL